MFSKACCTLLMLCAAFNAADAQVMWDNFDDQRNTTYSFRDGNFSVVPNRWIEPNDGSATMGQYQRNGGSQYDIMRMSPGGPINDLTPYLNGTKSLSVKIWTTAPGKVVQLSLEDSNATTPTNYPTGRLATFTGTTTTAGVWETITLSLTARPDPAASPTGMNVMLVLFDPGLFSAATWYFDDLMGPEYTRRAPVVGENMLFNFDGISSGAFDIFNGTELQYPIVNPDVAAGNTSAHVGKYVRNPSEQYNVLIASLTSFLTGVSDYNSGSKKMSLKVRTDAPVGTEVEIVLQNNSRARNPYPTGRHSVYSAVTTVSGAWETLVFTKILNPDASQGDAEIDNVVIEFAPNAFSANTYYFDELAGPALAGTTASGEFIIENFSDIHHQTFGTHDGTLTQPTANPAPDAVNMDNAVGKYQRNGGAQYDVLMSKLDCTPEDVASYLDGSKKFSLKVFTDAPIGTPISFTLQDTNSATGANYPTGRHSVYSAVTTSNTGWQNLNFTFESRPDAGAANTSVNSIAIMFNSNSNTGNTYYIDDFAGFKVGLDAPVISASGNTVLCAGSTVTLTSSVAAGNNWSTGETTQSITVNAAGNYTVRAMAGSCTSAASAPVAVSIAPTVDTPTITLSGDSNICSGSSLTITSVYPTGNVWSTGETTQSIVVSTNSRVFVQNVAGGCTSAASQAVQVRVSARPEPQMPVSSAGFTICNGDSTTLSLAGNFPLYHWSTGAGTPTIQAKTAGRYWVRVAYTADCWSDTLMGTYTQSGVTFSPAGAGPNDDITITVNPAAVCGNLALATDVIRWHGGVKINGSQWQHVVASNGAEEAYSRFTKVNNVFTKHIIPASYNYTTAGETATELDFVLNGGAASNGWFLYEGKDNTNACGDFFVPLPIPTTQATSTAITIGVTTIPAPVVSAAGVTTFCSGNSVDLTSTAGDAYIWSSGETTRSINVSAAGNYTVKVVVGGCTSAASAPVAVTVNGAVTPVITATGSTILCGGASVVLTSTSADSYIWSNGETTQSITTSQAADYTVRTITAGCTSVASAATSVTIAAALPTPSVNITRDTAICSGNSVTLTSSVATGNLWSNGETTQSITVSAAGSFTVQTVSGSCTSLASSAVNVTVSATPNAPVLTAGGPLSFCQGISLMLMSSSPTGNLWSTGETTDMITVNASGTYSVRQISGNCTSAASNAVAVNVTPTPATPVVSNSGSLTICSGGLVTLTSSADTGNRWSTGETGKTIAVTSPGTYSVYTVTGACSSAVTNTIVRAGIVGPIPVITAGGPVSFCTGGSVTLSTASATTIWSNGARGASITVTAPGTYTARDTSGECISPASAATTVTVNAIPNAPTITVTGSPAFCTGGSVTLRSSSATGNLWSNNATTQTITVNVAGSYTVSVTANGCTSAASAAVQVTENSRPAQPVITYDGTVLDAGSYPGASFTWYLNTGAIPGANSQTYTPAVTGVYTVMVTDANGCSSLMSVDYVVLGLNAKSASFMQIVPNPAGSYCRIAGLTGSKEVNIYSIHDQRMHSQTADADTYINLQNLAAGVYEIRIGNNRLRLVKNQ
ncbi:MAG: hypothetical protein V4543_12395 [Bacteroidota bacterium]